MKLLNGSEIVDYIKERQIKQVRALRQAHGVEPKLVVIQTTQTQESNSLISNYQNYAKDIMVDIEIINLDQPEVVNQIIKLNINALIHGIFIHLPLPQVTNTDEVLNTVNLQKDVSGMADNSNFDAIIPLAIDWLLAGYNVDLRGKNIVIVGQDKSISSPLLKRWQNSGHEVTITDKNSSNFTELTSNADVLVIAENVSGLIKPDMVKPNVVIVDAGLPTVQNGLSGDVAREVRQLPDIKITAEKDGLWPLVVCALFDNVIRAAQLTVKS